MRHRRYNLLHITCNCSIVVNKPCAYDFPIVLHVTPIVCRGPQSCAYVCQAGILRNRNLQIFVVINLSKTISENQLTNPPHICQSPPICQPNWPRTTTVLSSPPPPPWTRPGTRHSSTPSRWSRRRCFSSFENMRTSGRTRPRP